MAIVRAHYTRSRSKIKATLRYIIHRPGREGERLTRELFGNFEEAISKADAYQLIDAQQGMTYFHLKFNFHPTREDSRKNLDLRDITRQSMFALTERLQRPIRFLAVEHNDHTDLRHIHAIILVHLRRGERIGRENWKVCRETATDQARLQRRALDAVMRVQRDMQREGRVYKPARNRFFGMVGGRATKSRSHSQRIFRLPDPCPECDGLNKQSLKTLRSGAKWCRIHGVIRKEHRQILREKEQGLGL
jgi:hypothetical protein